MEFFVELTGTTENAHARMILKTSVARVQITGFTTSVAVRSMLKTKGYQAYKEKIGMEEASIKFKFNQNDRCFKKDEVIELNLIKGVPFYLVGPNGSGKTTLMHYIRAKKHSLKEENKSLFDGMTNNDDTLYKDTKVVDIEGMDGFENIFVLDSIDDDPTNFINSATAYGLVAGGGFNAISLSKGQKAKDMLGRFFGKIQKHTDFSFDDYKAGKRYDKETLIIVDEVDEGIDLRGQSTFHIMLGNLAHIYNAFLICICHNPICTLSSPLREFTLVYDMSTRSVKLIQEYIKEQTGLDIKIRKNEEEHEKA